VTSAEQTVAGHDLALRAALLDGPKGVAAWRAWRSSTTVDELEPDAQWLLALLYCTLRAQGVAANELVRYASVYRHHWYRNMLMLRQFERATVVDTTAAASTIADGGDGVGGVAACRVLFAGAAIAFERVGQIGARPFQAVETLDAVALLHGESLAAELATRARPVTWRGATWWVIDPADHLVFVCLGGADWDSRSSLLWLSDAASLIVLHPDIDGARVERVACRLGRTREVDAALRTVAERCGVQAPWMVVHS